MRVEERKVKTLRIYEIDGLDQITVALDDIAPRHGKITIECYGQAWLSYWGAMDNGGIAEFFSGANNQYLIGKLAPGLEKMIYDYNNLDEWFKAGVIKLRRQGEISRHKARELWMDVEYGCKNSEHYLHTEAGSGLAYDIFGSDWWFDLPKTENHEYEYLSRIIDVVKEALRK